MTTPERREMATMILQTPQWSLSMKHERTIVKAGAEKNIAVQSPRGILATASERGQSQ